VTRAEKQKKVLWPFYVGGGAIVVAGLIIVLSIVIKPDLGDKCTPGKGGDCPSGARCPAELKKCVAPVASACEKNELCLSQKCTGGQCAPLPLGEPCFPSEPACESALACSSTTKRCSANSGGTCRTVADCLVGACTPQGGRLVCGEVLDQRGCQVAQSDVQCPADQKCVADKADPNKTSCLLKPGQLCPRLDGTQGGPKLCSSQRCNDKALCAPDNGSCTIPSDCAPPSQCTAGQEGKTCKVNGTTVKPQIDISAVRAEAVIKHIENIRAIDMVKAMKFEARPK
jgi:hypothetical protein